MNLVYKNENTLKLIAIVISLVVWLAIIYFSKALVLVYVLLFGLVYLFAQSGFIAYLRGTGVRVSDSQYPDVHRVLTESCRKLGIDPVPECYVLRTNTFNALATRFLGRNFVVLFADVLETLREHPDSLGFYLGHELGHLARRHLQWHVPLMPASFLPLLGTAHRRAQEYTCDRHGLACSPSLEAAQLGLLAIATSGSRLAATNVGGYIQQSQSSGSFWMSFHELIGDYPWLTKRVAEITAVGQGGAPEHPRRNPFAWVLAALVPRFGAAGGASILITVAMIGVLAAIAIPAYQDYTVRAQVSEGLSLAAEYKAEVAGSGAATVDEVAALSSESLNLPSEVAAATYVDSITVQSGAVVIVYGKSAHRALGGQQLVLTPAIAEDGSIEWICGPASAPPGTTPVIEDYAQYTSVMPKYLPAACRSEAVGP